MEMSVPDLILHSDTINAHSSFRKECIIQFAGTVGHLSRLHATQSSLSGQQSLMGWVDSARIQFVVFD